MSTPCALADTPARAGEDQTNKGAFIAEVLVSAGPRKSAEEYREDLTNAELCEDCAGLCWVGDQLVFWLCDGGSNAKVIPRLPVLEGEEAPPVFGFSARILAQDLGQAFAEHCSQMLGGSGNARDIDLTTAVFAPIASAWEERLLAHKTICEARRIPFLLTWPEVIHVSGETSRCVDWTTTFTGGVFSPKAQQLALINYGASGALVATSQPTVIKPNNCYISLRATVWPEKEVNVSIFANSKVEWIHLTEVEGFAVMSDGLKEEREFPEQLSKSLKHGSLKELRTELLRGAVLVEDDKSIVFGRYL